jgi:hypothetical protein
MAAWEVNRFITINGSDSIVELDDEATLTNKTLTAPTINNPTIRGVKEKWNVVGSAATGTINFDILTSTAWLYTNNATANWTLNVRGNGSNTLNSLLSDGDSVTIAFAATQGTTAYYNNVFQIDGNTVTPKWQGALAPSAGNASSQDVYTYTIIKTATNTYTVYAARTRFA